MSIATLIEEEAFHDEPQSLSPIVVWGAGAIGGAIGASFIEAGQPVIFVDNVAEHVAAINLHGLRITAHWAIKPFKRGPSYRTNSTVIITAYCWQ